HRRARQQPGEDDLCQVDVLVRREALQRREPGIFSVDGGGAAAPQWRKRNEGDALALARGQNLVCLAGQNVVAILHGYHFDHRTRGGELRGRDVADADVADLAGLLQACELADRVFVRHVRIRLVHVVQRDLLELQPFQARLTGRAQVLRTAVDDLKTRPGCTANLAALGRDHQVVGVGVEGVVDEALAQSVHQAGTVHVRAVDVIDAQIERAPQQRPDRRRVSGDDAPGGGEFRGAQPDTVHLQVAADPERAGGPCGQVRMAYAYLASRNGRACQAGRARHGCLEEEGAARQCVGY